jgi:hypothetical protein
LLEELLAGSGKLGNLGFIGGTKTRSDLKVKAVLDTNGYETGIKVSEERLEEIQIRRHRVHPAWNYTISSRRAGVILQ